jgi:hypothetical protein
MYWSKAVLEHKLERFEDRGRVEEVYNLRSLPKGMGEANQADWLYIAYSKKWRGFFRLVPEVLYTPEDKRCPYALIFDVKSWTALTVSVPCKPFRGWTYSVPPEVVGNS